MHCRTLKTLRPRPAFPCSKLCASHSGPRNGSVRGLRSCDSAHGQSQEPSRYAPARRISPPQSSNGTTIPSPRSLGTGHAGSYRAPLVATSNPDRSPEGLCLFLCLLFLGFSTQLGSTRVARSGTPFQIHCFSDDSSAWRSCFLAIRLPFVSRARAFKSLFTRSVSQSNWEF